RRITLRRRQSLSHPLQLLRADLPREYAHAEGETRKSRKTRTTPFQPRYDRFLTKLVTAMPSPHIALRDSPRSVSWSTWISSFVRRAVLLTFQWTRAIVSIRS